MTLGRLRSRERGVVLAGVKAMPFGWPAASLDPGCGRHPTALPERSPRSRITNLRSPRFQGIAAWTHGGEPSAEAARRTDAACDRSARRHLLPATATAFVGIALTGAGRSRRRLSSIESMPLGSQELQVGPSLP
jgi:hypothetical protein